MTVVLGLVGAAVVFAILRDIFHTLWHPSGFGGLSRSIFRAVWRLSRTPRLRRRGPELAGPIALVAVVVVWTGSVIVGFALAYLPLLSDAFRSGQPGEPTADPGTALYVSAVAVGTLGLGDIVPTSGLMRAVVPFEALVGFLLLTAAISWVLQVYPALSRRRMLARNLTALRATRFEDRLTATVDPSDIVVLEDLRAQVAAAEVDLVQYAESYYFRERDAELSLAAMLPYAERLVGAAEGSQAAACRAAACRLRWGLDRLCDALRAHLAGSTDLAVPVAYARDHRHTPRD